MVIFLFFYKRKKHLNFWYDRSIKYVKKTPPNEMRLG